ncbi:glycosyltransferase [Photobacterium sp. S4TG1]|uniref:glycosyltransferase family 2 protein n=1 Tax=Photobacterium sp. S4TG1 TaxID=3114587 RepID=UPI002E1891DE|nr:glycosyltransferase [Photobacterium sp. S4TG1]
MIKLSVIIAAYNVEVYIKECIESVINQIDESVEIIVVNDGSTDNTEEILSIYKNNVSIYTKTNGGLSDARNYGIEKSSGEYITFLDGDDIWLDHYYKDIKSVLCDDFDIVTYNAVRGFDFKNDKLIKFDINKGLKSEFNYKECISQTIKVGNWYSWARVYKRYLFDNIKFPVGKRYEDLAITPLLYLKAKKINFLNNELIGYRINPKSITKNVKMSDVDDIFMAIKSIISDERLSNKDKNIFLARMSPFMRLINVNINQSDFSITKDLRMFILANMDLWYKIRYLKSTIELFFPNVFVLLSSLKKHYESK